MKDKIEELYNIWQNYKDNAEHHDFIFILDKNSFIEVAYKDLQDNWSNEHAEIFIMVLINFLEGLGIKVK